MSPSIVAIQSGKRYFCGFFKIPQCEDDGSARAEQKRLRTLGEAEQESDSGRWAKPGKGATPGAGRNRASSNSAAENAARGPRCSVFLPGWRKTRPWGLSRCSGVAKKARKGAAKREKRQESRQWGRECHAVPMQRGPMAAFPAILRAKTRNRRFPQRKTC